MRHRARAMGPCGSHQVAGDHRPGESRDQGVLALVAGVGPDRGADEVRRVLGAHVHHHRFHRPGGQGAGADGVPVTALSDVGGEGDYLDSHLLGHPAHRHRRVEATAVGKHDSFLQGLLLRVQTCSEASKVGEVTGHLRAAG